MRDDLVLYRFFDADGALLYVGKSVRAWARFSAHRQASAFYPEASQVTLERGFATDTELLAAEAAAIRSERPKFNVAHNRPKKYPPGREPNPCGGMHHCGRWVHGPTHVCRERDKRDRDMADRLDAGESAASIAADYHCSPDLVIGQRDRMRKELAEGRHACWECAQHMGIAIAKAKGRYKGRKPALSDAQAAEVAERLAAGESATRLAEEFGVARATVYNARARAEEGGQ